jgi:hypothetical protein
MYFGAEFRIFGVLFMLFVQIMLRGYGVMIA